MVRGRRIREFIPCEPAPNLNRCAGWTRCLKPGRFLLFPPVFQISVPVGTHFWFLLANRIRSWRPSGCLFSSAILTFLFLVFTLNLLTLLAKWKCTCLAKKNWQLLHTSLILVLSFLLFVISCSHITPFSNVRVLANILLLTGFIFCERFRFVLLDSGPVYSSVQLYSLKIL